MPNNYFQLLNHAYSFSTSTVNSGGVTFSLPQNDYGVYGQKVDALFGSLSNAVGGTQSLSAWFVSDAGLTYYSHDLGASAAVTAYIQSKFPINAGSQGYGLIDLRGSADWNQIIGDGIVGPTRGSTASIANTNCQQYIDGVVTLFGLLKTAYPSIDWAIAGLPYIPYQTTYAPMVGESFTWSPSLTNSGGYAAPYWWDPQHPVAASGDVERFFDWYNIPTNLSNFYKDVANNGPQRQILDNCGIGWLCPDIRIPYTDALPFYGYGYNPIANYNRNKELVLNASDYGNIRMIKTYPLISNMYPSRKLNSFDDRDGNYTKISSKGDYLEIDGSSYTGSSANSSESFYPLITFRLDMINAAVQGNAGGFIYHDAAPAIIDGACAASVTASSPLYDLQIRSRNMFSHMFYGGAYSDGFEPIGGYTASGTLSELRRFCSNEAMGYLNEIRESINVATDGANENQKVPAKNGWIRAAEDPKNPITHENQDSTNTTNSDIVYGEQKWGLLGGDSNNCNCPDPCEGVVCEPTNCCECQEGDCICDPNCDACTGVVCDDPCCPCVNGICECDPNCNQGECTCCGGPWNGGPCLCPDFDPEVCGENGFTNTLRSTEMDMLLAEGNFDISKAPVGNSFDSEKCLKEQENFQRAYSTWLDTGVSGNGNDQLGVEYFPDGTIIVTTDEQTPRGPRPGEEEADRICGEAYDRVRDRIRKAQEDLRDCIERNIGDLPVEREYLNCRERCIQTRDREIEDWLINCLNEGGQIPRRPPPGWNCGNGQNTPPFEWYGASYECQQKWCEIVRKYVQCMGGENNCDYDPCSGCRSDCDEDEFGATGIRRPFPPGLLSYSYGCGRIIQGISNGCRDRGWPNLIDPEREMFGSSCWKQYYKEMYAAQCESAKTCAIACERIGKTNCGGSEVVRVCCKDILFDTTDYCEQLGCSQGCDNSYPPTGVWNCPGLEAKIACLERRYENAKRYNECQRNLAIQHCTELYPDDTLTEPTYGPGGNLWSPRMQCIFRWFDYVYSDGRFWHIWECRELASVVYQRNFFEAVTDDDRIRAKEQYDADLAECDRYHEEFKRRIRFGNIEDITLGTQYIMSVSSCESPRADTENQISSFGSSRYLDRVPGTDSRNKTDRPYPTMEQQNYIRGKTTNRFLINRKTSQSFANWYAYYESMIDRHKISTNIQSQATTLNPSVSTNALKSHVQKDNTIYYPGHYFSP